MTTDLHAEFTDQLPYMQAIIRSKVGPDDERLQNSLCHAWPAFCRSRESGWSVRESARYAAFHGSRRRRSFGSDPMPRGHKRCDALDIAASLSADPLSRDTADEDREPPAWRIADMPLRLQLVAAPLAAGSRRVDIARALGVTDRTIRNRLAEIREWVQAQQPVHA